MPPLLAATALRVDAGGVPAIDGLTVTTTGEHVLVLGAARALFQAVAGQRAPVRGELRVEGVAPLAAIRAGVAAFAPLDPAMPPRWTILQYATWSARLAGHPRGEATALAAEALARMQLDALAETRLAGAAVTARRGCVVAAALATGAKTLIVDDPLAGLAQESARPFARVLVDAMADRRTLVFAARVPLQSPLAFASDEAVVVDGSHVTAQGAPAEIAAAEHTVALRVQGQVDAFARAVQDAGGRALVTPGGPRPVHVRVELGPLASKDLLRLAAESQAVVLELRPLARAFA